MHNVKSPTDLLDFMKANLKYGWIGVDGSEHVENLQNFRQLYRISSLEEVFKTGLGTCIESAVVSKTWFDNMGIENRLYCHRSYETEDNFDNEVKMHIIILFNQDNSWYHFEHSNRPEQGIHKYESIDNALRNITKGFEENADFRVLTEIDGIPSGLTFKEFNNYVNNFEQVKLNTEKLK